MSSLTCIKADWSSLSPSMWAVSPIILGPISSTKSSKSIKPPTVRRRDVRGQEIEKGLSDKNSQGNMHLFMGANVHIRTINQLTSHLDLLHYLQQLHFCRHVPHGPHAFCHVFIVQVSILIVVKLLEGLLQLYKKGQGLQRDHNFSRSGLSGQIGWGLRQCCNVTIPKLKYNSQIYRFKNQNSLEIWKKKFQSKSILF